MNDKKILVVQPYFKKSREFKEQLLNEGVSLVNAINLKCVFSLIIGIEKINPKTYFMSGNTINLKEKVNELRVNLIFINTNLSPIQQRNLERSTNCKIIDRTGLILEIFGSRARSNEGKLSVLLASLRFQKYFLCL